MCSISIFNLCLIAHNRYIALTQPLQNRANPQRRRLIAAKTLGSWLCGFAIWIPAVILLRKPSDNRCAFLPDGRYVLILCAIALHVPILAMLYFYCKCLVALWRRQKDATFLLSQGKSENKHPDRASGITTNDGFSMDTMVPQRPLSTTNSNRTLCNSSRRMDSHSTNEVHIHVISDPTTGVCPSTIVASPGHSRSCQGDQQSLASRRRQREHVRSVRSLSLIILALILSLWPWYILWPLESICSDCVPSSTYTWSSLIIYFNSLANPFLYFICNREFRVALVKLLHRDAASSY